MQAGDDDEQRRAQAAPERRRDGVALAAVVLLAAALAAAIWLHFDEIARLRWTGFDHDRNVHYRNALLLALGVRDGDFGSVLFELDRMRLWPPLHAVLSASAMLVGGIDPRVAIVPNLVAWAGTVALAFACARRAAPAYGRLAGGVAALLTLGSPAHRAYATDVMLESLGACLTLLALHGWLGLRGARPRAAALELGIALSLLLFEKYNYWLLVVLGLGVAELALAGRRAAPALRTSAAALGGGLARALRLPLAWAIAGALAVALAAAGTGPWRFRLGPLPVEIRSAAEPLHVAWILGLVACARWWRRGGGRRVRAADPRLRALLLAHGLPLALFFALPGRLGKLIAFVGPGNAQTAWSGPVEGTLAYARWVASDYHAAAWSALLAAGLAGVGALAALRARSRALGPLALLAVGAGLAILHPNHQPRYAHPWIAHAWVLAGGGAAALVGRRGPLAIRAAGRAAVAAALAALLLAHAPLAVSPGRSSAAGHRALGPTTRDVSDVWLALAGDARRVAFASDVPIEATARWSLYERRRDRAAFAGCFRPEGDPVASEPALATWLAGLDADVLILVEVADGSPLLAGLPRRWPWLPALVAGQDRFRRTAERALPGLGVVVSAWARAPGTGTAPAPARSP